MGKLSSLSVLLLVLIAHPAISVSSSFAEDDCASHFAADVLTRSGDRWKSALRAEPDSSIGHHPELKDELWKILELLEQPGLDARSQRASAEAMYEALLQKYEKSSEVVRQLSRVRQYFRPAKKPVDSPDYNTYLRAHLFELYAAFHFNDLFLVNGSLGHILSRFQVSCGKFPQKLPEIDFSTVARDANGKLTIRLFEVKNNLTDFARGKNDVYSRMDLVKQLQSRLNSLEYVNDKTIRFEFWVVFRSPVDPNFQEELLSSGADRVLFKAP